jgi:hypothetical protein
MDGTRKHHVKQNKPDSEREVLHFFLSYINLDFFKDMKVESGTIGEYLDEGVGWG